jgi:hypothetical protein
MLVKENDMHRAPTDLPRFFDDHVSRELQQDLIVRCILKGYREAAEECDERYAWEQAHDVRPHVRRAKIEQLLRGLPARHPEITAVPEINDSNNAYHVRVTSGRVTFTISAVDQPTTIVRYAVFRETLARRYQMAFAGLGVEEPPPSPDALVYALIIHGPAEDDHTQRFPGFVRVVFPTSDCSDYIDQLDLLARFRELPEFKSITGTEEIPDKLQIGVRQRVRERGSDA